MKNISVKQEFFAILTNRKLLIPIIAVMFIPVLYAGMFLWAFWDPYEKLSELPVAVVNSDAGTDFDGKQLELGSDLAEKLKESSDFKFEFLDRKEAYKKLRDQKYYMLIEIPEDFSKNATTLLDDTPKKLELTYVPNESYNFLSAQIGGTAVERIKASLSEKITETYAETMFDKIGELAGGVKQASEGAGKLSNGSEELKNGSEKLNEGLQTLAQSAIQFNSGLASANEGVDKISTGSKTLAEGLGKLEDGHLQLSGGAADLSDGSVKLAQGIARSKQGADMLNSKMPEVVGGTSQLVEGANTITSKAEELSGGAQKTAVGAIQLDQSIGILVDQLQPMMSSLPEPQRKAMEAKLQELKAGSAQLAGATAQVADGAGKMHDGTDMLSLKLAELNKGQTQIQQGISQLAEGGDELDKGAKQLILGQSQFLAGMNKYENEFSKARAGAEQLARGSSELTGGINKLAVGSDSIRKGTGKLANGSNQLKEGTESLSEGSKELADKLSNGADEASKIDADDKTYNMIADPVMVDNEKINNVPNYGTGFAPYFLSLGLFVGALLLSIVFPLREPAGVPSNGVSWFTGKFSILAAIGVVQALLADFILLAGLGIHVESIPAFILFSIVTSLTFIALIQFLVTTLGDPGRFIAIIILILQLTTSAGTFPLELVPNFLQHFNAYLPMTYSVAGFKAVISSGDFAFMTHNILVLVSFMAAFALGTLGYFIAMHKRQFAVLAK